MMNGKKLRLWELAALLALSITLCVGTWAQAAGERISSSLIRLHVVAASDDEYEQALKLRVRDAVLDYLDAAMPETDSVDAARAFLEDSLDGIRRAAADAAEGRTVRVTLEPEYFPTKDYGGFSLPAGRYEALRIVLGEGRGHNWWCVVFPPVCLSSAQDELLSETMGSRELGTVKRAEGYELRFRAVELWGNLAEKLSFCTK